jgi:ribose transport system ATP-binding protein
MAAVVELAAVPAVVVTLGASFVWLGLGLVLQPTPGGSVPGWMESVLNASLPGVPEPVYLIVAVSLLLVALLRRTRYGVALRAFGNNRRTFSDIGRSVLGAMCALYALAGLCAILAGAMVTTINTSSDINGSATLTLASFAAVVVGGSEFLGGLVAPVGTVMASVALGLIVSFMALVNLPSSYVSATEGGILILAMVVRLLGRRAFAKGLE